MNPYQVIEEKLASERAVLMVTRMERGQAGLIKDWSRVIYTEGQLLKDSSELLEVLKTGKPQFSKTDASVEKIDIKEPIEEQILIEPFFQKERLIIFGGGHIALPLCKMASMAGFRVTLVDDRPSFANRERFPQAEKVICNQFSKAFEDLNISSNDFLVVVTRGHKYDEVCLREILKREETLYTGMIGSKRRVATVFSDLKSQGFDSDRINRICSPIGLTIGAITPEEISISILAEVIRRKRLDHIDHFLINRSEMEPELIPVLAGVKEPCALVTIIATNGSAPRRAGAKMLVGISGIIDGSVGGGCSESEVMHTAISIIGTGKWEIVNVDLTDDDAEKDGMVCGGTMQLLVEDFIISEK